MEVVLILKYFANRCSKDEISFVFRINKRCPTSVFECVGGPKSLKNSCMPGKNSLSSLVLHLYKGGERVEGSVSWSSARCNFATLIYFF